MSYDISMSRELGGMIYQWVGNKELRYIKLGRELGAMIYQWVGN
jgi:hypothetical protein